MKGIHFNCGGGPTAWCYRSAPLIIYSIIASYLSVLTAGAVHYGVRPKFGPQWSYSSSLALFRWHTIGTIVPRYVTCVERIIRKDRHINNLILNPSPHYPCLAAWIPHGLHAESGPAKTSRKPQAVWGVPFSLLVNWCRRVHSRSKDIPVFESSPMFFHACSYLYINMYRRRFSGS